MMKEVEAKAKILGSNLRMGKGKKETIVRMLDTALHTGCFYCGEILTLKNVTLDHRIPYDDNKIRKAKSNEIMKLYRMQMDSEANLRVICRPCNERKGSLSETQYKALLNFLSLDYDMEKKVLARLAQSKMIYRGKK